MGTGSTSEDLAEQGISADLAVHYVRSGWLTHLMRGAYTADRATGAPQVSAPERAFLELLSDVGARQSLQEAP